jgi:K+-transporting ATPase ATPase A chain
LLLVKPLGSYMAWCLPIRPIASRALAAAPEKLIYRLCGIRADEDMGWKRYALAMLVFNVLGLLVVYCCSVCSSGCR